MNDRNILIFLHCVFSYSSSSRSQSLSWALEHFLQENLAQALPNAQATLPEAETAIHTPLREMGFQANLITEALRALNLDGNEVTAQAINQCANWMSDHQTNAALR